MIDQSNNKIKRAQKGREKRDNARDSMPPRPVRTACRNRTMRHVHQSTKNSSGSSAGNLKILFSILFLFFKGSPCRDGCTFVGRCCDTKNRRSRACEIRSVRNRLKRHDAGAFFFVLDFSTLANLDVRILGATYATGGWNVDM